MSEMTYDEALEVLAEVDALAEIGRDIKRLEKAYFTRALSPTPEQVAESEALGPEAEYKAAQLLHKAAKKEAKRARREMSKALIAAGVGPRERKKIYRLQKRGFAGQQELDALFAEIAARKTEE